MQSRAFKLTDLLYKGLDGVVEPDDARHLPEGSDRLQA